MSAGVATRAAKGNLRMICCDLGKKRSGLALIFYSFYPNWLVQILKKTK
jgi:hypothetical protein